MAVILDPTPDSLNLIARHLAAGGIAALPTETVYGLAADATNPEAVALIFQAKKRPSTNPLIVHLAEIEDVLRWTNPPDDRWRRLADAFWPGPLTLILPKSTKIPDSVTAALPSVAVRIPDNELTREVIRLADRPLAAPSANPSGYVSPTMASHVAESLGDAVPYVLDGGSCRRGIESTIVDLSRPGIVEILRRGPITVQEISRVLGLDHIVDRHIRASEKEAQLAPGLFSSHYQPTTRVYLWHNPAPIPAAEHQPTALVHYRRPSDDACHPDTYWLSETGNAEDAARNLYHTLRQLDHRHYRAIYMQIAPPDDPLGLSINDRLYRAASGHIGTLAMEGASS